MAIELRGRSPPFVSTMLCAADRCPATVEGNVSDVSARSSVGETAPLPVKATVWDPTLSLRVKDPLAGPDCLGANSTINWQALFAASELPHPLLASTKGAVTLTLATDIATLLLFSAVICKAADVLPTST